MTTVDMSKRIWRVTYRDEQDRRCHCWVNGNSEDEAVQAAREQAGVLAYESAVEVDKDGRKVA